MSVPQSLLATTVCMHSMYVLAQLVDSRGSLPTYLPTYTSFVFGSKVTHRQGDLRRSEPPLSVRIAVEGETGVNIVSRSVRGQPFGPIHGGEAAGQSSDSK